MKIFFAILAAMAAQWLIDEMSPEAVGLTGMIVLLAVVALSYFRPKPAVANAQ